MSCRRLIPDKGFPQGPSPKRAEVSLGNIPFIIASSHAQGDNATNTDRAPFSDVNSFSRHGPPWVTATRKWFSMVL